MTHTENNKKMFHKMIFVMNALEDGWKIKKVKDNKYVFYKKIDNNNGEKSLKTFIDDSMSIEKLIKSC